MVEGGWKKGGERDRERERVKVVRRAAAGVASSLLSHCALIVIPFPFLVRFISVFVTHLGKEQRLRLVLGLGGGVWAKGARRYVKGRGEGYDDNG